MDGLKDGATASSDDAKLTITDSTNMAGVVVQKNTGFKVVLNSDLSSKSKNLKFKVKLDNYEWEYTVEITETLMVLNVSDSEKTFNNADQEPDFYVNKDNKFQGSQNDYFTWKVCDKDGTNCVKKTYDSTSKTWNTVGKKNAGAYTIKITPKSSDSLYIAVYDSDGERITKEVTRTFIINAFELTSSNTNVTINNSSTSYTGQSIEPNLTVTTTIGGKKVTLVKGTDYYVSSDSAILNAGTYNLSIVGMGNYRGTLSNATKITINQVNIANLTYDWTKSMYWTGSELKPAVQIKNGENYLIENTDYTVSYSNNIDVGTGKITITGKGNYTGTKVLDFSIVANEFSITEKSGYALYNGSATSGGAEVKVNNCANATIKYGSTKGTYNLAALPTYADVGTYTIYYQVSATGYATREGSILIQIVKAKDTVDLYSDSQMRTKITELSLTMPTAGTVYGKSTSNSGFSASSSNTSVATVSVSNNVITITPKSEGSAKITVSTKANNNYDEASTTLYVNVVLGTITGEYKDTTYTYDGNSHSLAIKTAFNPADASLAYTYTVNGKTTNSNTNPSLTNAGSYLITYTASKSGYYSLYGANILTINPASLNNFTVTLNQSEYTYDGNAKEPVVTVKNGNKTLTKDTDYVVTYKNNVDPGTATVTIKGTGNYTGSKDVTFQIKNATIVYKKANRTAEYSGYAVKGSVANDAQTLNGDSVTVTFPSSDYQITYGTADTCANYLANKTNENKSKCYSYTDIPRFRDQGNHTVYFRITAKGYNDIEDTFTTTIRQKILKIPTVFSDYIYTGQIQSPSWLNYNSRFMNISGDTQATAAGTYTVKFSLKAEHKNSVVWEDGTKEDKTVNWTIQKIDIKTHELVVENDIAYNEIKQVMVSDGRATFDRTGYTQIAWVESCEDKPEVNGISDRECNYSKYTAIKQNISSATTEEECKTANGKWNAATNTCVKTDDSKNRLNYYETGSSFSGMYIADYLNYDQSKTYDLYAVWSKVTYKIEYDLCDAKGCGKDTNNNPSFVSYDSEFTITNPEREGYLFMGWEISGMDNTPHIISGETSSDTTFTVPEEWIGLTQDEKVNATVTMKNLTSVEGSTVKLKAIWQPIKYKVVFNRNNNSYYDDNNQLTKANTSGYTATLESVSYDIESTLSKNQYKMNGYDFTSWIATKTAPKDGQANTIGGNKSTVSCTAYSKAENPKQILANGGCLTFSDEEKFENLTSKNDDTIYFYAQWKRRTDTQFKVTYWQQNIDGSYSKVGTDTWKGQSDSFLTLTPYSYKQTSTSTAATKTGDTSNYIYNTSPDDTSKSSVSGTNITNVSYGLKGANFRGFTLNNNTMNYYNSQTDNNNKAYKFILSPNSDLNINVYYTRNTYTITYQTDGGSANSTTKRKYQVAVTFGTATSNGNLKETSNSSTKAGSGDANFVGWFGDSIVKDVQVYGVNGEVTTDETIYAKWLQYRYSGANNNEKTWTSWNKKQAE